MSCYCSWDYQVVWELGESACAACACRVQAQRGPNNRGRGAALGKRPIARQGKSRNFQTASANHRWDEIEERERERGSITEQQPTANSNIIEHAMATIRAPSTTFLSAFLPVVRARLLPHQEQVVRRIPLLHQIQQLRAAASLLPAVLVPIPSLLEHIWDGILKAVPKKKTSHMKKRHRQMAGKALKDVTALNKCSACGRTKRAHVLCPYCVNSGWYRLRRA